ncbi:uncharacterized protein LOC122558646 [Chiloscyllium plagiosum]|uniref:uncharacterized protein LOC122558646 n=1 Tax=Chiloscyllium plagiosum TaxID=36176 RepID=UPI001CB84688|nr:uncharacterized protein LOC122558646 [Chiloscyllium plagiosum]
MWYKNFSEITSGINIRKILNEEGLFQVSSELSLPERESVYTCQVSHVALSVPANISDKIPNHGNQDRTFSYALVFGCAAGGIMILVLGIVLKGCKSDRTTGNQDRTFSYALVFGCAAGGIMILVLGIVFKRCKLDRTTGNAIAEDMNSQFEEQINRDREAVSPIYAALHFSGEMKPAKLRTEQESFVYAQEENRVFNEEWELQHFPVAMKDKMMCSLCNTIITPVKKCNAYQQFATHEDHKYAGLEEKPWKSTLKKMVSQQKQQQVYKLISGQGTDITEAT